MIMNIEHMIEQMPELGITKKVETRTVHFKDEHILNQHPIGHVEQIVMYITKHGNHMRECDIVRYHKLQKLQDQYNAESIVNEIEFTEMVAR